MISKFGIGICTLNQFALDFEGNLKRIIQSLDQCLAQKVHLRTGPELEICGYSCEDAFFEIDTELHSWQIVAEIIKLNYSNLLIDLGMPILFDQSLYNCRIILLNNKVVAIRAKTRLANNGNYRESRWFTAWTNDKQLAWYQLPEVIAKITNQTHVPFGSCFVLQVPVGPRTMRIGFEMCEELWQSQPVHETLYGQYGCDLVCNGSASYWEIRKLNRTRTLIESASGKCGGAYVFTNLIGCDGSRLCFYGRSAATMNGKLLSMCTGAHVLFKSVHVDSVFIEPDDVIAYRRQNNIRPNAQHQQINEYLAFDTCTGFDVSVVSRKAYGPCVISMDDLQLTHNQDQMLNDHLAPMQSNVLPSPEQEIAWFGSVWLWDYLRRSRFASGFIVPLSGGLDSASVACLVYVLSDLLAFNIDQPEVLDEVKRITQLTISGASQQQTLSKQICGKLLHCLYLRCVHSGSASESRAKQLAHQFGAQFVALDYSPIYRQTCDLANDTKRELNANNAQVSTHAFASSINNTNVSIGEQNLQARLRMVLTYLLSDCNRLVLATGNVDEALVGYFTKYDCSAADLNPIGSLAKLDLRRFVRFVQSTLFADNLIPLQNILDAIPSAELSGESQADEIEIGLTYEELGLLGSLRRGDLGCYGPYGMFCKLWNKRAELLNDFNYDACLLASKVKRFFTLYARNRHKQTVLTPALHAVSYSPDDNRFDHRQFLFATDWRWQFRQIDQMVSQIQVQIHTQHRS